MTLLMQSDGTLKDDEGLLGRPNFAGLSGCRLPCDRFDLGNGLVLSATYAHIMRSDLLACTPSEPGKPHPQPWVSTGHEGLDLFVQLEMPSLFTEDRMRFFKFNAAWFVTRLLYLHSGVRVEPRVFADRPFAEIARGGTTEPKAVAISSHGNAPTSIDLPLSIETLEWVKANRLAAEGLMTNNQPLYEAFQAFDLAEEIASPSVALLVLWGALESLFKPGSELGFRMSAYIASYLEPVGAARRELQAEVAALYRSRSKSAHGAGAKTHDAHAATKALFRRVTLRMLAQGRVPETDDLLDLLFGGKHH